MGIYEVKHEGEIYQVKAESPEAASVAFDAPQDDSYLSQVGANIKQTGKDIAGVADFGLASTYGIAQTASRLWNKYAMGEKDVEKQIPAIFGYDMQTEEGKEIAKVLGYIPEKIRSAVVGVGGEAAGDAMDAAGLILLGKGGYKGAKTPKAIMAHEHQGAVRVLSDAGVPLTLADRSTTMTAKAAGLSSDTLNALSDSKMRVRQVEKFTEAALKNAKIEGKTATPEVMGPRLLELQQKFDLYDQTVHTKMDPAFASELQQLTKEATLAPENVQSFVQRHVDHLQVQAAQNGGVIPGEALHMARTALDKATSDPTVGTFAAELRGIMDDALERQAPPKVAADIRKTRAGYKDMKAIEKAVKGNPSGLILPDSLFRVYSDAKRGKGTVYGVGETPNHVLARAGAKILGTDPLAKTSPLAAVPMSAAGVGMLATGHPALAAGLGAGLVAGRFANENQVVARALGGRGLTKTSRALTKTEALGAYYSATEPEARKRALEELKRAHTPE